VWSGCGGLVLVLPGESSSHRGQAQGPHPPSPPLLVPTNKGSILLATTLIMHEILLAGNMSLSKEGRYTYSK